MLTKIELLEKIDKINKLEEEALELKIELANFFNVGGDLYLNLLTFMHNSRYDCFNILYRDSEYQDIKTFKFEEIVTEEKD